MNLANSGRISRGNRAGFTMTEMLVTVFILSLVMATVLTLYISIQRFWRASAAKIEANRRATMALNRLVYGSGSRRGLRAARADQVQLQGLPDGWVLSYVTGNGQTNRIEYQRSGGILLMQPGGVLLGESITNAFITINATAGAVRLETQVAEGQFRVAGAAETTIRWRN